MSTLQTTKLSKKLNKRSAMRQVFDVQSYLVAQAITDSLIDSYKPTSYDFEKDGTTTIKWCKSPTIRLSVNISKDWLEYVILVNESKLTGKAKYKEKAPRLPVYLLPILKAICKK